MSEVTTKKDLNKKRIKFAQENIGDLAMLEEIERQLEELHMTEHEALLEIAFKLNFILTETEINEEFSKYNIKASELYHEILIDLLDKLEIDFNKI